MRPGDRIVYTRQDFAELESGVEALRAEFKPALPEAATALPRIDAFRATLEPVAANVKGLRPGSTLDAIETAERQVREKATEFDDFKRSIYEDHDKVDFE